MQIYQTREVFNQHLDGQAVRVRGTVLKLTEGLPVLMNIKESTDKLFLVQRVEPERLTIIDKDGERYQLRIHDVINGYASVHLLATLSDRIL